jgi:hypothetical protein
LEYQPLQTNPPATDKLAGRVAFAHLIGASRETVNKALANFTNRGWRRVDGRSVLIFEPERLARRAR